jgi:hypothetical protein
MSSEIYQGRDGIKTEDFSRLNIAVLAKLELSFFLSTSCLRLGAAFSTLFLSVIAKYNCQKQENNTKYFLRKLI